MKNRWMKGLTALALMAALMGCRPDAPQAELLPAEPARTSERSPSVGPPPAREVFHESQPYRFQNSLRGLRAASEAKSWIDIDSNYAWDDARKSRVALATHWPNVGREGFMDPLGTVGSEDLFADLTLSQVRRLRSQDSPPYRVYTMEEMVEAAAQMGVKGIEWEVKGGQAFERPNLYRPVLDRARELGLQVNVKTIAEIGGKGSAWRRLRAAKEAGAVTILISKYDYPAEVKPRHRAYVDYSR